MEQTGHALDLLQLVLAPLEPAGAALLLGAPGYAVWHIGRVEWAWWFQRATPRGAGSSPGG